MFDKREDHNIKNIKKIIEFLKETKCKYLASLHFKNQFISPFRNLCPLGCYPYFTAVEPALQEVRKVFLLLLCDN